MRNIWIAIALGMSVLMTALGAWEAQAMSSSSLAGLRTLSKQNSSVQKAACLGFGGCGLGFHRVCNRWRCWCRPCL
jgi:hypothetical protein